MTRLDPTLNPTPGLDHEPEEVDAVFRRGREELVEVAGLARAEGLEEPHALLVRDIPQHLLGRLCPATIFFQLLRSDYCPHSVDFHVVQLDLE